MAKIWRSRFSCIFQSHRHGTFRFFQGIFFTEKFANQHYLFENFQKSKEKGCFWMAKIDPLTNFFHLFFTHLLGLSESYVLDPRTLIQDSKWGFPAMIDPKWSFLCGSKQLPIGLKQFVRFKAIYCPLKIYKVDTLIFFIWSV